MESIQINDLNKIHNSRILISPTIINMKKRDHIRLIKNKNNIYNDEIKKLSLNKNSKSHKKLNNKKLLLPILNNNISVTNRNIKLFLQTNKLEVKTDKNIKKEKKLYQKDSIYGKIHDHFNNFDLLKLNYFGDDYENYGNITLKGISYPPKKIKIDFITKRANEEEFKNNKKIFNFEDDEIIDDSFLKFQNSSQIKYNKNNNLILSVKEDLPLLKSNIEFSIKKIII